MPSDPFSTTYQGAFQAGSGIGSLGQGIQGAAGAIAQVIAKKNQQKQSMSMLQQLGILGQDEPNLKDYEQAAQEYTKQSGKELIPSGDLSDEGKLKTMQTMFKFLGIPTPKTNRIKFDYNKASEAGLDLNLSTGDVKLKPTHTSKSSLEQAFEIQSAQEELKNKGMDKDYQATFDAKGNIVVKPKTLGMGGAYVKEAQSLAPTIADQVESGVVSGYTNSPQWVKAEVAKEFKNRGKNLDEHVLGYSAEKTAIGNIKIVDQKVQNANSAQVLLDASYDPKTGDYKVAPSQHAELAIATARMLSPTGVVSDDRVAELRQGTMREKAAKLAIWFGSDPAEVGGSTQSVINMFAKLIQREGGLAQKQREDYMKGQLPELYPPTSGKSITDAAGITGGLKQGDVKKGYKFLGGNPADKNNWEKQ